MKIYEIGVFSFFLLIIVLGVLEQSYRIFPCIDLLVLSKNMEYGFVCDDAILKDVAVDP